MGSTRKKIYQQNTMRPQQQKITLDEEPVINGNGATAEGETVTISEEGTYVLSGTLSDGQLIINASKEAKIHLIFNGVSITNTSGSAVNIQQAEKVILTLADNKTNNLKDGENYSFAENEKEPDIIQQRRFND